MKFVMLTFLTLSFAHAIDCDKVDISVMGEVKYSNVLNGKKVKRTLYEDIPKSWNVNSNSYHKLVINSEKEVSSVKIKSVECKGCKKSIEKEFDSELVSAKGGLKVSSKFELRSILSTDFVYPGIVDIEVRNQKKTVCNHQIKLERIK